MNYILSFIVLLGVLIIIHEFGHFIVARLYRVGVEKFSIGFGPKIVSKKIGFTEYRLGVIPFGGYVKLVGEEPDAKLTESEIKVSFSHKSVFKRLQIIAAGPIFNIIFAILIFFWFYIAVGVTDLAATVKNIEKDGPAYRAGLQKRDVITLAAGLKVESWQDIENALKKSKGEPVPIVILREGREFYFKIKPDIKIGTDIFGDPLEYYDFGISAIPEVKAMVGDISKGFPAHIAGIKPGDTIAEINGVKISGWSKMHKIINSSMGRELKILVKRGKDSFTLNIQPRKTEKGYLIGIIRPDIVIDEKDKVIRRFGPVEALIRSLERTWMVAELTLIGVGKTIGGSLSADNVGGPIMIAKMAGDQAKEGIDKFVKFMAFISISLAMLNLLPFPALDGGHLLFIIIEIIMRRPVPIKIRTTAHQIGIVLLFTLMILVSLNDVMRYI